MDKIKLLEEFIIHFVEQNNKITKKGARNEIKYISEAFNFFFHKYFDSTLSFSHDEILEVFFKLQYQIIDSNSDSKYSRGVSTKNGLINIPINYIGVYAPSITHIYFISKDIPPNTSIKKIKLLYEDYKKIEELQTRYSHLCKIKMDELKLRTYYLCQKTIDNSDFDINIFSSISHSTHLKVLKYLESKGNYSIILS